MKRRVDAITLAVTTNVSNHIFEYVLALVILIIAITVQAVTDGRFFTTTNISDLLRETSILLMASMALMVVVLTGGIDLSLGSIMGLSGMVAALLLKNNQNINLVFLFVIAMTVGLTCGLINGFIVSFLKVYPLIGTLATKSIFRGVIYLFSGGYWVAQAEMTPSFISIATTDVLGINSLIWFAVFVMILIYILLRFTSTGRSLYAVGNSEKSSAISGINVKKTKMIAYSLCGLICGLVGILWICKYGNAQSESAEGYEISVIAAVTAGGCSIAGGQGTVTGVMLGTILIGILNNILPLIQVSTFWQQAIKGAVILISIILNAISQEKMSHRKAKKGYSL